MGWEGIVEGRVLVLVGTSETAVWVDGGRDFRCPVDNERDSGLRNSRVSPRRTQTPNMVSNWVRRIISLEDRKCGYARSE